VNSDDLTCGRVKSDEQCLTSLEPDPALATAEPVVPSMTFTQMPGETRTLRTGCGERGPWRLGEGPCSRSAGVHRTDDNVTIRRPSRQRTRKHMLEKHKLAQLAPLPVGITGPSEQHERGAWLGRLDLSAC